MGTKAKEEQEAKVVGEQSSDYGANPEIHVGSAGRSQHTWLLTKRVAAGLALLAVVLVGAATLMHDNGAEPSKAKDDSAVVSPKTAESDAQNTVSDYLNQTDQTPAGLQASVDKLTALAQSAKTTQDKQTYNSAIVQLYVQAGNYDGALTTATQANDTIKTASTAAQLAGVYEAQQDYANAAKYYALAVSLSPKTAPEERSGYNDYLAKQKQMEAKL